MVRRVARLRAWVRVRRASLSELRMCAQSVRRALIQVARNIGGDAAPRVNCAASSLRSAVPEVGEVAATHTARTAVVVTDHPEEDAFEVIMDSPDIDIAVFESPAKAFMRIKREQPAVVIVCLSFDSATEFQLLSALKLDRETAAIPIWTCANLHDTRRVELIDYGQAGAPCSSLSCSQLS